MQKDGNRKRRLLGSHPKRLAWRTRSSATDHCEGHVVTPILLWLCPKKDLGTLQKPSIEAGGTNFMVVVEKGRPVLSGIELSSATMTSSMEVKITKRTSKPVPLRIFSIMQRTYSRSLHESALL